MMFLKLRRAWVYDNVFYRPGFYSIPDQISARGSILASHHRLGNVTKELDSPKEAGNAQSYEKRKPFRPEHSKPKAKGAGLSPG